MFTRSSGKYNLNFNLDLNYLLTTTGTTENNFDLDLNCFVNANYRELTVTVKLMSTKEKYEMSE